MLTIEWIFCASIYNRNIYWYFKILHYAFYICCIYNPSRFKVKTYSYKDKRKRILNGSLQSKAHFERQFTIQSANLNGSLHFILQRDLQSIPVQSQNIFGLSHLIFAAKTNESAFWTGVYNRKHILNGSWQSEAHFEREFTIESAKKFYCKINIKQKFYA